MTKTILHDPKTPAGRRVLGADLSSLTVTAFIAFWVALVLLPLAIVVVYSFFDVKFYQIVYEPTLDTWRSTIGSGRWMVAVRTLRITLTVTLIEILLALPFALWLSKGCRSRPVQAIFLTLLTISFFLDISPRVIVWRPLLGTNGIVNTLLMQAGITDQPVDWLLYSEFAVHFGLIGTYFPTMVFPIFLSISLISDDLIAASKDLGANPAQTFWDVILPMAMPGILVGIVFTSVPLMAAFVEPQIMGGGFVDLLGNSVDSALAQNKISTAASLSTLLVGFLVLTVAVALFFSRKRVDLTAAFTARHD